MLLTLQCCYPPKNSRVAVGSFCQFLRHVDAMGFVNSYITLNLCVMVGLGNGVLYCTHGGWSTIFSPHCVIGLSFIFILICNSFGSAQIGNLELCVCSDFQGREEGGWGGGMEGGEGKGKRRP